MAVIDEAQDHTSVEQGDWLWAAGVADGDVHADAEAAALLYGSGVVLGTERRQAIAGSERLRTSLEAAATRTFAASSSRLAER